jgi:[ribosomal protein S18]-alanine N-acetyltransferase
VRIRSATIADVPSIIDLERASPSAGHWNEQQYVQFFETAGNAPERLALVVTGPGQNTDEPKSVQKISGFLVARHVASEWELENIVVAAQARRKGVGKALLQALLDRAQSTESKSVFLEVRGSNAAARALYESAGFQQTGRRKSYYANPAEDAILYRLDFRR